MADKVTCKIEEESRENSKGREVRGVCATCSNCNHQTFSFGTGENSRKRCLALLREECPHAEENFYVDEDEE